MEGIILVAGYGSRLRHYLKIPKYYINIHGYPLLYYPYYSLYKAGVSKIYLVFNEETLNIYRELEGIFNLVDVDVIVNPHPELDNGYTLLYALSKVDRYPIVVSVSDHIYPYHVVSGLIELADAVEGVDFYVVGDANPNFVDVSEATKIMVEEDRIVFIGKELMNYSYIDMGIFLFNTGFRKYVETVVEPITINSFLNRVISIGGYGKVYAVENIPWKDIDTYEDYILVTNHLYEEVFKVYFNL